MKKTFEECLIDRHNKLNPQPQVNFEEVDLYWKMVRGHMNNKVPAMQKLSDNFDLFMKKLKSSSSFAHRAHKELQKL